jgi:hypothetical protein
MLQTLHISTPGVSWDPEIMERLVVMTDGREKGKLEKGHG